MSFGFKYLSYRWPLGAKQMTWKKMNEQVKIKYSYPLLFPILSLPGPDL